MKLLALLVLAAGVAEGAKLGKLGMLKCSACKVVVDEMLEKRRELLGNERQPVQVSHRLGNGKWDPHGGGGVKKVGYANSELMAIEATEGLCSGISGYKLRYAENGDRVFSKDAKLGEAEGYNKLDSDCAKKPNKILSEACNEFLDEFDEEIHELIRIQELSDDDLTRKICVETVETCQNIDAERVKEAKNKAAFETRREKRWEKTRLEGGAKNYQIAEFHFSLKGDLVDTEAVVATSESNNHPSNEGPEKLLDSDLKTKCLDNGKKGIYFNFTGTSSVDAFTFSTADDFPERDPIRWTFQISEPTETITENTTWVNITTAIDPPYPTPFERGVMLPWFNFTEVEVAGRVARFLPIFTRVKKVKKEKKNTYEKPKNAKKAPKVTDLKPGLDSGVFTDPDVPHFKMSTHDEDGKPNALYDTVKKISEAVSKKDISDAPNEVPPRARKENNEEEL